jgi:hypothetical protein
MHARYCIVISSKFLSEPFDFVFAVAENDSLGDCEGFVEVAESIELVLFLFDCDEELFNSLKSELVSFD